MAKTSNKTFQLIIITLVLLFILVILPLGSWYYLQNGLNYRITTMSELKNYGTLPAMSYATFSGTQVADADLKGKVVVANVLNMQDDQSLTVWGKVMEKLHDQFDERKDVRFLIHVLDTTQANITSFSKKYKLDDYEQCYFIPTEATALTALAANYHVGADSLLTHFILVDTKNVVRKHYNVQDEAQVKRLVEHLALLLPLQKKEEISIQMEREK